MDDNAGNNNGKIDPGETVDIIVTLKNNGDITADNIDGIISSTSGYLTIVNTTAKFWYIGSRADGARNLYSNSQMSQHQTVNW